MKILVTGGTGFIGSHTTVELQNAGYDVVIVDNLSNSRADVIDGIEKITGIRPAFEKTINFFSVSKVKLLELWAFTSDGSYRVECLDS